MSLNKCGDVLAPREVCCELCNPLYEGFCSSRDILGQRSPRATAARRPAAPAPPALSQLLHHGPGEGGTKPRGTGGPRSAPKHSMGRRWGAAPHGRHCGEPQGQGQGMLGGSRGAAGGTQRPGEAKLKHDRRRGAACPQELALVPRVPAPSPGKRLPGCQAWQERRRRSRAPAGMPASPATAGTFLLISSRCPRAASPCQHPAPRPPSARCLLARGSCIPPAQPGF